MLAAVTPGLGSQLGAEMLLRRQSNGWSVTQEHTQD